MNNRTEMDELVRALREDLPTLEDESRVRKNLENLGLFGATSGLGADGAHDWWGKQAASWAPAPLGSTWFGKLVAAFGGKGAIAVASVGVALAGPVAYQSWQEHDEQPSQANLPSRSMNSTETANEGTRSKMPERESTPVSNEEELPPVSNEEELRGAPVPSPGGSGRSNMANGASQTKVVPTDAFGNQRRLTDQRANAPGMPREGTPSSLEVETSLIEAAIYAHRRGDRERAMEILARHAREFREGKLAVERQRLRARWTEE